MLDFQFLRDLLNSEVKRLLGESWSSGRDTTLYIQFPEYLSLRFYIHTNGDNGSAIKESGEPPR